MRNCHMNSRDGWVNPLYSGAYYLDAKKEKLIVREVKLMNRFAHIATAAVAVVCFSAMAPKAEAQVDVDVDVGVAPDCPYGYYDYEPYDCAPHGYYGPAWFDGGIFIGVGPWFHGPRDFRGHVDTRFDSRRGYRGHLPGRGEAPEPSKHPGKTPGFRGNEMHDGHGRGGGERH